MRPWADVATFWTPKSGSALEEYEDASWIGPDGSPEGERHGSQIRLAVSDGASESMLASRWARLLARSFGRSLANPDRTMARATSAWNDVVESYLLQRKQSGSPIQWYEEPGLARGAFATLLAVELRRPVNPDAYEGTWRALAIGDSCVFQVREDQLTVSFPITEHQAFGNSPQLVPSKPNDPRAVHEHIIRHRGRWKSGDSFYVATDALAAWFLHSVHMGERPWAILRDLGTDAGPPSFEDWVFHLRSSGAMHNDDVTLVRVDIW
jgi:hypothetical protein